MKISSSIVSRITFGIIISFFSCSFAYGQSPVDNDTLAPKEVDTPDEEFTGEKKKAPSFWTSYVFGPMSWRLSYEVAYKFIQPGRIRKNRFSLGLKYAKSLSDHFSVQIETKVFSFLKSDHRTRSSELWLNDKSTAVDLAFGSLTKDAYIKSSFHKTSIKVGMHTVDWGESEFAMVTNEISPLDYREPLNLNIDELRFAQLMLNVDQYTPFGNWTAFFIPFPKFNQHPKKGTAYYMDPFKEGVEYQMESPGKFLFEYGLRWKKTFGKSDVSVMAARLINNEYALRLVNPGVVIQSKEPYFMSGATFNYALKNFLIKGEAAIKFSKTYNNALFQIIKKNAFDASLGVDYTVSSTFTLGLEAVNYRILDWNHEVMGLPRNNFMLLFILGKKFMNDDLSVNCVTMYNGPYTSFFNLLTASYSWNDHLTTDFYLNLPVTKNVNSGFYRYRDEKLLSFSIQYQF
jgi:hypothetical protein